MKNRNRHFQPPRPTGQRPAMHDFALQVATGQVCAYDRLRKPIKAGHLILQHPTIDPVYEVVSITPVLDPTMGPGLVHLTVTATFNITVPVNQPLSALVIVGDANEQRRMLAEARGEGQNHNSGGTGDPVATPGAGVPDGEAGDTDDPPAGEGDGDAGTGAGDGAGEPGGEPGHDDPTDPGGDHPSAGSEPAEPSGPRRIIAPGDSDFKH